MYYYLLKDKTGVKVIISAVNVYPVEDGSPFYKLYHYKRILVSKEIDKDAFKTFIKYGASKSNIVDGEQELIKRLFEDYIQQD